MEKFTECLLYNFHRELNLPKLKIKMLLQKIISKNLTAGVFFSLGPEQNSSGEFEDQIPYLFTLINSEDVDENAHNSAFPLGLHYLPIQNQSSEKIIL